MKLTRAERLVVSRIVNIRLDSATLRDHILLEGIYKAVKPEEVSLKTALDFVKEEDKVLFEKYQGMSVNEIPEEEDKRIIIEAIQMARVEELKIFSNEEEGEEVDLTKGQAEIISDFFDKDKREFPREHHSAIVALHDKIAQLTRN